MAKSKHFKKIITIATAGCIVAAGVCFAISHNGKHKPQVSFINPDYIVKSSDNTQKLYYQGTLLPAKTNAITAPFDGSISSMNFQYGDHIKKGQLLFTITSKTLANTYKQNINDYFKAKNQLSISKTARDSDIVLYKHGLIPKNTYQSAMSDYENNVLALYQAKLNLDDTLKQLNIDKAKISNLTLANTKEITQLLNKSFKNLAIYATHDGTALYPVPGENNNGDDNNDNSNSDGKLHVGSSIKADQLLLSVGNNTGLMSRISVDQVDIDQIHPGLKVIATSPSFPNITLNGFVKNVSSQADNSNNGGDSSSAQFDALIYFPKVSAADMKKLRIGMNAKITILISHPKSILVPLTAVGGDNDNAYVKLYQNQEWVKHSVKVGSTTDNQIQIISGLKNGDKIKEKFAPTSNGSNND